MISASIRAAALANGAWVTAPGRHIPLRSMNDHHLVNALLRSIEDGEPDGVIWPLVEEVVRRGLIGMAVNEVERRTRRNVERRAPAHVARHPAGARPLHGVRAREGGAGQVEVHGLPAEERREKRRETSFQGRVNKGFSRS